MKLNKTLKYHDSNILIQTKFKATGYLVLNFA